MLRLTIRTLFVAPIVGLIALGFAGPGTAIAEEAEGSLEDRVAEVQRMLQRHGFDPGPIDGRLGLRTRDAIRAYQDLVRAKEDEDAAGALTDQKGPPVPATKPAGDH